MISGNGTTGRNSPGPGQSSIIVTLPRFIGRLGVGTDSLELVADLEWESSF